MKPALARKPAVQTLLDFKINGMHQFGPSAGDLVAGSLEQAHAIAIMVGSALLDADETASTNPEIIKRVFEGIASLIALSGFAGEEL